VPISLDSDFDQTREHWVKEPMDYLSSAHLSPDGNQAARRPAVASSSRRIASRLVEATNKEGVRYRDARFLPDGKTLRALSDQSGEVEPWTLPPTHRSDRQLTAMARCSAGRACLARRPPRRPSRQEPAALPLRSREEGESEDRQIAARQFRVAALVARQQVAGLRHNGGEPVPAGQALLHCREPHHARDHRPLR
jgi:hypothetical protein